MKTKKRILIDGLALLSPFTGIAKYTYENAFRLKEYYSDQYEWYYDYGFHSRNLIKPDTQKQSENFLKRLKSLIVSFPILKSWVRQLASLSGYLFSSEYDLYWQPNFIPKRVKAKRTITTVHDFSFYLQPEWHPEERLNFYQKNFWEKAGKSDWIITGSYFTQQEIIDYMHYPAENIEVIYHAVDHNLYKPYETEILYRTKKKFDLKDQFLLFVGSIEPRKNLLTLLKAYRMLPADIKREYPLILVGFKGWENKEIMHEIQREKTHIHYLGYLSDEELAHIYNLATLFIYPSLYEGFGIPPLEAMACGTPVLASHIASIPEVCGDAAIYCEPYSENDISQNIVKVLQEKPLQYTLIKKGFARASMFTWEKAAKAHKQLFDKVLS